MAIDGTGLLFEIQIDHARLEAPFLAIGSREYPRACQYAVDETAKSAKRRFDELMPRVLGNRRFGTSSILSPGGASAFTLQAVRYQRSRDYDSFRKIGDITSSISIQPLQSTYLKYLFGDAAENARDPGDVGLASDRILVPNAENLRYAAKVRSRPYARGGGALPRDVMEQIAALMDVGRGNGARVDAMRAMGRTASARAADWHQDGYATARNVQRTITAYAGQFGVRGLRTAHRKLLASIARIPTTFADVQMDDALGFVPPSVGEAYNISSQFRRSSSKRGHGEIMREKAWRVYQALDRHSGLRTYYARPPRMRDPAGGYHEFRRSDGTLARMPNMTAAAPQFGEVGSRVGPRRLFAAVDRADYKPILQQPWTSSAEMAYGEFEGLMMRELDRRLTARTAGTHEFKGVR